VWAPITIVVEPIPATHRLVASVAQLGRHMGTVEKSTKLAEAAAMK